jgi:glycosyltransferase involved in cell wall biosynthesis
MYNDLMKVSIIIPIYNSEKFIKESLNSLINQTFKNFELICDNNDSTDNTLIF